MTATDCGFNRSHHHGFRNGLALVQRTVSILIIAAFLVGCGPIPELEERVEYWSLETATFLRGTVTIDDIHPWLRERGVIYTFDVGRHLVAADHYRNLRTSAFAE
jgi:hypothetical protein